MMKYYLTSGRKPSGAGMNTSGKYSTEYYKELYRIQDKVLKALDEMGLNFYLSGGTALGRFFLNHRYSDDLDFMGHNDVDFIEHIQNIGQHLSTKGMIVEPKITDITFSRFWVFEQPGNAKEPLKIDFLDEKDTPHFGPYIPTPSYSKVDNLRNILANKLSFISRKSPKDIADIWLICKNLSFRWDELIGEASQKRVIEELQVVQSLKDFKSVELNRVNWINPINIETFDNDREKIIEDIITKNENQLFSNKQESSSRESSSKNLA
jgi:hypothetical protein